MGEVNLADERAHCYCAKVRLTNRDEVLSMGLDSTTRALDVVKALRSRFGTYKTYIVSMDGSVLQQSTVIASMLDEAPEEADALPIEITVDIVDRPVSRRW